jgi:hypothetical protein
MEAKKIEELTDAKRGSWAVSGVLAVVVLAVLILSGRNVGAPVVWVQTAAASFRQGEVLFGVFALCFVNSSNVIEVLMTRPYNASMLTVLYSSVRNHS